MSSKEHSRLARAWAWQREFLHNQARAGSWVQAASHCTPLPGAVSYTPCHFGHWPPEPTIHAQALGLPMHPRASFTKVVLAMRPQQTKSCWLQRSCYPCHKVTYPWQHVSTAAGSGHPNMLLAGGLRSLIIAYCYSACGGACGVRPGAGLVHASECSPCG